MNKMTKRAMAAVLCGALALTACSCGNTTGTALTIDGTDIPAGVYICYQMDAYSKAQAALAEAQPDLDMYAEDFDIKAQTIEGVNAEEWIKNKTFELCRNYVAANKAFDEYGLSLTAEQQAEINQYVTSAWKEENMYAQYLYGFDTIGEYYESKGVGEKSYKETQTLYYKQEAVFNHLYGEGGELEVPAEEISAKILSDYALVLSFEVDPAYGKAQDYVDMLNGGTSFTAAKQAYDQAEAVAEAEEAKKEAEEAGEEYDGTLPEDVVVAEVEESTLKDVVNVNDVAPSESYVKDVFAMANSENKLITVSEDITGADGTTTTAISYYVVKKLDISADAKVMEEYSETVLFDMKSSELEETLKAKGAAYSLTENAAAIKLYTIDKIA